MGRDESTYAGLLFSQPTFLSGAARSLDLGGVFNSYNYSPSPDEADRMAIASDWYAVGADLLVSLRRFAKTTLPSCGHGKHA